MSGVYKDGGFYTIGDSAFSVLTTPYTASLARVYVPDKNGVVKNVTMGLEDAEAYKPNGGGGMIMCPNAGRIMSGKLPVGENTYQLALTGDVLQLHGGPNHVVLWETEAYDQTMIRYRASQKDGLDGWPGNRTYWVTYTIDTEKKMFRLTMEAETDKPTYVNMGSHAYWNMSGDFSKTAFDEILTLRCSHAYMNDENNVSSEMIDVTGGPYDYREPHRIAEYFERFGDHPEIAARRGYDNAFVLDHDSDTEPDIRLWDPESGRRLSVKTDARACVIFTGGGFRGRTLLHGGVEPARGCSVALECHDVPNTPNNPNEAYHILNPGERFCRNVEYRFDIL